MSEPIENPTDLLKAICKILDDLIIDYFVSGGVAVTVWGRPRFTADIDLVVNLEEKNLEQLSSKLSGTFDKAYVDIAQMKNALKTYGEFNIIEPNVGMKIDFWILKNEEYDKLRLERSVTQDIGGYKIRFISPEDLIISKLIWFKTSQSTRQLEDISSVFSISKVDNKYIRKWVAKLGLENEFKLTEKQ